MEDFKMKKVIISILLILSMLLALASCDMLGKKDDPEENVDYLVSSLNEGTNFEEIKTNTETVDVNEMITKIKEAAFEMNLSGTVDGETGSAYLGLKDKVLYLSSGAEGEESEEYYVFIEDDWTLVTVAGFDGEYYGNVDTSLKEMMAYINTEEETTTAPADDEMASDAMGMIEGLLDTVMSIELPEATAEDVEYKDGKYYLKADYIKSVLDKCIDVVFDELGGEAFGMTSNDILDYKAAIKGYLEYINVEVYYYIECEEITGVGMAVSLDETFAAEKIGYSDIAISFEICIDKLAVDVRIANEDDVLADVSASVEYTTDKDDKLETLKVDVNAEISSPSYEWDEESYDYVETVNKVTLAIDLDANFADMAKGKGEFLTCSASYSDGVNSTSVSVKADSSDKGDKISCDLTITVQEDGETQTSNLNLTANLKSAPNMPAVPQGAIDAKDAAIEEYNNSSDWWY